MCHPVPSMHILVPLMSEHGTCRCGRRSGYDVEVVVVAAWDRCSVCLLGSGSGQFEVGPGPVAGRGQPTEWGRNDELTVVTFSDLVKAEVLVGASGWEYMVPYQSDMAEALASLRRLVFAEGSYVNPSELGLRAPATVDELEQEPYWEFMGTSGTHSILDVLSVVPADDDEQEYATIRPLTDREYRELWGNPQPTRDDFGRVSNSAQLHEYVDAGRNTGRAAVLWADGSPSEIAFWGYSGD